MRFISSIKIFKLKRWDYKYFINIWINIIIIRYLLEKK